jgi:competence transcription factor ComK
MEVDNSILKGKTVKEIVEYANGTACIKFTDNSTLELSAWYNTASEESSVILKYKSNSKSKKEIKKL